MMALRVMVEDLKTGEKGEATVPDDSYILITDGSAYLAGTQMHTRTHVITVKGLKNGIPTLDLTLDPLPSPGGAAGSEEG